jgi:hypothetical protein
MRRSGVRISSRAPKSLAIARVSREMTPIQKMGGPLTGHKLVHFRTPGIAAGARCELRPAHRAAEGLWVLARWTATTVSRALTANGPAVAWWGCSEGQGTSRTRCGGSDHRGTTYEQRACRVIRAGSLKTPDGS